MNRLLILALAVPTATIAQPTVTEAQRIENLCRLRPDSPVCKARLQGQAAAGKLDLAARVKTGEGWRATPETRGDTLQCWATLTAVRDVIKASGRATWPASYTPAALAVRIAIWDTASVKAYAQLKDRFEDDRRRALETAKAQVAGPNIVYAAETAGNCKAPPQ